MRPLLLFSLFLAPHFAHAGDAACRATLLKATYQAWAKQTSFPRINPQPEDFRATGRTESGLVEYTHGEFVDADGPGDFITGSGATALVRPRGSSCVVVRLEVRTGAGRN